MHEQRPVKLADGRQLGFAEYGNPNGLPVFYFHGLPGSRLEASCFHEVAAANRWRVIGIDRPGMGLSSIDKNRSLLSWATDVANFADSLGIDKFSIVGHSGGAPFVAACAYAIPKRVNSVAIISGMGPFEKPEADAGLARGQRIANQLIKTMPWLASVMMWLTYQMLKKPNMMLAQMIKQLPEVDQIIFRDPKNGKALIDSTIEAFKNGIAGPAQEIRLLLKPWGFKLEQITCPVTVWYGALDIQAPISHAHIYADLIPGAKLKVIENEGHHSLLKNHIEEILRDVCNKI